MLSREKLKTYRAMAMVADAPNVIAILDHVDAIDATARRHFIAGVVLGFAGGVCFFALLATTYL